MRRNLTLCLLQAACMMLASLTTSQAGSRELTKVAVHDGVVELQTSDGLYLIQPLSDDMVQTSFVPSGEVYSPVSHAVVLQPAKVSLSLHESAGGWEISTPGISVQVNKAPLKISYSYHGRELIAEHDGYVKDARGETLSFDLDASENLYGTGARALGMNRRGNRLPLYNKAHYGYETHSEQMNFSMPLVFSSKLYGIHFDNPQTGFLDLDSQHNQVLTYETIGGRKTYQIFAAPNWEQLVASYTSLTGRQPLPPRWALGNFSSRFGYHTEAEARAVVDQFIAQQIPLDAIIFDLYWFGKDIKGTLGNLDFDQDNFPEPKKMIADFSALGVKTVLITEPFILTTSKKWDEAVAKKVLATDKSGQPYTYDFYFGHTGLIDLFNPEAKTWFWNIYKKFNDYGVAGWWGDLGEPEVHPADLQHLTGPANEVHNIYGHNWAKLIADGYARDFPQQRPFILMRAGYSGSQRFGMIPWSGDVNRTWGGLQSQPEIALQMGMQGMGYMHSDLGGFAGANLDNELYVRWLQYGVFQPVFRPHAQEEVAAEPVLKESATRALAKAAIQLRYQLLPYNYTLAFENNQQGMPLMRPLMYEEPQNSALFGVSDSYLWGHEFLVKPVLQAAVTELPVYFPAKNNWFDLYTDQLYAAGSSKKIAVVAEHIPVFVRGGAFVPMIDVIQNTEHYSTQHLQLHYYHDAAVTHSSGKLYDDDGKTPQAFEQGLYALLQFASAYRPGMLEIDLRAHTGAHYSPCQRQITLTVHNIHAQPKKVQLLARQQIESVAFRWDQQKNQLIITVPFNDQYPARLKISLAANNN